MRKVMKRAKNWLIRWSIYLSAAAAIVAAVVIIALATGTINGAALLPILIAVIIWLAMEIRNLWNAVKGEE